MGVLYQSKGLSKATLTKKMISIIIWLVAMAAIILYAQSKVNGPTQNVVIGGINGSFAQFQSTRYRFSSDERQVLTIIGFAFGVMAVIEAAILGLSRTSWTEIHRDVIKGNFMGNTISYPIAEIKNVSSIDNFLIIKGSAGTSGLIAEDPRKARKIIDEILLNR